jgi:hypothetical protein
MNISLTKALQTVSDHGWLAFLLTGLAFVAIGAPGLLRKYGVEVIDDATRVVLLGFGLVLIIVSLFMKIREDKLRSQVTTAQRPGAIDAKLYDVQITVPKSNTSASAPVSVEGKMKKRPPEGIELWLFTAGEPHGERSYWPQDKVNINSKTSWQFTYKPANWKSGDTREIEMFLVGPDGRHLISFYRKTNSQYAKSSPWEPISKSQLTSDIVSCGPSQRFTLT